MVDGLQFADHLCVVTLGIGIGGTKRPLAVVEGSTEDTTLVRGLLVGLRDRGLGVTQPILVVLDGAKALSVAVKEVFDHPVIGRCQLHQDPGDLALLAQQHALRPGQTRSRVCLPPGHFTQPRGMRRATPQLWRTPLAALILWDLASDGCDWVPPGAGVKAGRRPPEGLGLDPGEDGTTLAGSDAGRAHAI